MIMKNNTTTLHDCTLEGIRFGGCGNSEAMVWKLGLDIELRAVAVARQCGRGAIGLAVKWSREQLLQWVKEKRAQGEVVCTVYESCGFGYTLHEQLSAAGANSLVSTPMRLNLERKRKNERMDARELCVRLSRYLDGQSYELRPIRIPSRCEQQRRERGGSGSFGKERCVGWKTTGERCASSMSTRHWKRAGPARASGRGLRRSAASLCVSNSHRWWHRSARPRRNWIG